MYSTNLNHSLSQNKQNLEGREKEGPYKVESIKSNELFSENLDNSVTIQPKITINNKEIQTDLK